MRGAPPGSVRPAVRAARSASTLPAMRGARRVPTRPSSGWTVLARAVLAGGTHVLATRTRVRTGVVGPVLAAAVAVLAVLALAMLTLAPHPAAAQDIEAVAEMRGIELPEAYRARVAADPAFFTLPNGVVPGGEPLAVPGAVAGLQTTVTGEIRLPVILALFSDSPEPEFTQEDIERTLFTGPAPKGTVTDYYLEISQDAFTFRGDVHPWVRTSLPMAQVVGDSYGLGSNAETGAYLLEALELVDPDVDFGLYDDDGPDGAPNSGDDDGFVDVLTFEFLEVAASCGGPSIWPHRSGIANWTDGQPYVTDDLRPDGSRVRINGYIIQGVTDCTGEEVQTAGTIAHELGHALGLPDYYHPIDAITPENRRWVLGCWALMAAGSWGCGEVDGSRPAFGPTHMIGFSKHHLGWLEYDEPGVVRDEEFELLPVGESARGLRVPLDAEGDEALLLEYRRQVSYDADLPAEGVLVAHHDPGGELRPQSGFRYRLRVAEADGGGHLLRTALEGGNRGDAGDVFGNRPGREFLHNGTTPSIRRNDAVPSTVTIHSIEVEGGVARVRLSTAPDPMPLLPEEGLTLDELGPVDERYRIAGGAAPWGASLTGVDGLVASTDEDELVLTGTPSREGVFDVVVSLVDALGTMVDAVLRLAVGTFQVAEERLVGHLLLSDAEPLNTAEQDVLDEMGNANGTFDVGDVRAWLTTEG